MDRTSEGSSLTEARRLGEDWVETDMPVDIDVVVESGLEFMGASGLEPTSAGRTHDDSVIAAFAHAATAQLAEMLCEAMHAAAGVKAEPTIKAV